MHIFKNIGHECRLATVAPINPCVDAMYMAMAAPCPMVTPSASQTGIRPRFASRVSFTSSSGVAPSPTRISE